MKSVILIHSNPQPWGRPTSAHTAAYRALPQDVQDALGAHWEKVFGEADAKGEIVYGCALGDPSASVVVGPWARTQQPRWVPRSRSARSTDLRRPYPRWSRSPPTAPATIASSPPKRTCWNGSDGRRPRPASGGPRP